MDDPERVRLGDRLARLEHVLDRLVGGHAAAPLHHRAEIVALEVLHHDVRRAAVEHADVHHAGDVLARDPRGRLALAEEARDRARDLARDREQELERDALLELRVARRDDDPMPPAPSTRSTWNFPARISPGCTGETLGRAEPSRPAAPIGRGRPHRVDATAQQRTGRAILALLGVDRDAGADQRRLSGGPMPSSDGSTKEERATAETSCRHSSHVLMCSSAAARAAA